MTSLSTVGLFAGIGGIEEGLRRAGYQAVLLCEKDPLAQRVLTRRFPRVTIVSDIRDLRSIPNVDVLAAGFPCQDLSQAGSTAGIHGSSSRIVREVFRLLSNGSGRPTWLVMENVPFMLRLNRGEAMKYLTRKLEELGLMWAYRVVDTRAFGVPQRRHRVIILASRDEDPRGPLLACNAEPIVPSCVNGFACGFYWTEGSRGLGWAINAVPPLKGGSRLSIPSPPAIWLPHLHSLVVPDIRDAERLQGFGPDWSKPEEAACGRSRNDRWRLVGSAVTVPIMKWLGKRLARIPALKWTDQFPQQQLRTLQSWPLAAWGRAGEVFEVKVSAWPIRYKYHDLEEFLKYPTTPLSFRATRGFWDRARSSRLRFHPAFLSDVEYHLEQMAASAGTLTAL